MGKSKVTRDNYICIQGWMILDLELKGNELLVYACIYGFSQAENQVFSGGLQYLADWTRSTKRGVMKTVKSLVEKGLVEKKDRYVNDVKFCEYRALKTPKKVVNSVHLGMELSSPGYGTQFIGGMELSSPGGGELSSPNNILNNNILDNKRDIYTRVCSHLNQKAGTSYKPTSKATQRHINARLAEGYTVEDFITVIDKKCAEWLHDQKMRAYLRPETLFGSKFEGYLNAPERGKNDGIAGTSAEKRPTWGTVL